MRCLSASVSSTGNGSSRTRTKRTQLLLRLKSRRNSGHWRSASNPLASIYTHLIQTHTSTFMSHWHSSRQVARITCLHAYVCTYVCMPCGRALVEPTLTLFNASSRCLWDLSLGNTVSCTLLFFLFYHCFICDRNIQQHSSSELPIVAIPLTPNSSRTCTDSWEIISEDLSSCAYSDLQLDAKLQLRQMPEETVENRKKSGDNRFNLPFARTLNPGT
jgi:hypothetical protein